MKRLAALLTITLTILALPGCVQDKPAPHFDSPDRNERIEAVTVAGNTYAAIAPAASTANTPAEPPAPVLTPAPLAPGGLPNGDIRAIAGCWAEQAGDQVYFRIFNANGTCKEAACIVGTVGKLFFIYHTEGTYRLLPGKDIELTCHTAPNDRKVQKLKYRLSKDTLELKMGDHWRKLKRVTP